MTGLWLERVSTAGMRYSRIWEDWSKGQLGGLNQLGQLTYEFYFVKKFTASNSKPIIMAMGRAGYGKSTVLNRLIGSEIFETRISYLTDTNRDLVAYETADFTILENPGFLEIDPESWIDKLNSSPYRNKPVDLVLMCFAAKMKYDFEDHVYFDAMFQLIEDINVKNVRFIMTGVEHGRFTQDYLMHYVRSMHQKSDFDCPPKSNVFLFKGSGVEATDQLELSLWVKEALV